MGSKALDSLRILAGSGMSSNAQNPGGAVMGRANQESRLSEMKRNAAKVGDGFHTGALPFDIQSLQGDLNSDPDFGTDAQARVGQVQDMNNSMSDYARPDVAARRGHDEAFKMALAGEPARVAGAANLASANAAGEQKYRVLQEMLAMGGGGRTSVSGVGSIGPDPSVMQGNKDDAAMARVKETAHQHDNTVQIQNLLKNRSTGFLGQGFFGTGNAAQTDAEIARLSGNGDQREVSTHVGDASQPAPSNAPPAPAGWKYVPKPGGGWTAVRL